MNAEKYYIYYIRADGGSMFLTGFKPSNSGNVYEWTVYRSLYSLDMPLFFPTLEQVETFVEDMPIDLLYDVEVHPKIGRWLTMSQAKRNEHNDPYEFATWKPDDS